MSRSEIGSPSGATCEANGHRLEFPGTHEPRGVHMRIDGVQHVLGKKRVGYALELAVAFLEDHDQFLFNEDSEACDEVDKEREPRDCHEVARDRARHLRKIFGDKLEAGSKSYRLSTRIGEVVISTRVLSFPPELVKPQIIDRLRRILDGRHGLDSHSTSAHP